MEDKHQPDSSNSVQMGIKHKQGMPMQSQFEQAILDVYDFCMKEKEAGVPIIPLNHFAKRVTEMLKVGYCRLPLLNSLTSAILYVSVGESCLLKNPELIVVVNLNVIACEMF